jgi:hypothetical protein
MKKILLMSCILTGCMNVPVNEIYSASSQKLCERTAAVAVSEENRELMYKELESRGDTCIAQYNHPRPPQPQRKQATTTNCYKVGDNVTCTTR